MTRPAPGAGSTGRTAVLGSALLVALVVAAYLPVLAGGFELLNIDDHRYIMENPRVTAGLTREGIRWALTSLEQSNWHPLTWMSWQLDVQVHGLSSWGFHLTNVLLHVANVVLVFLSLYRMTGAFGRSVTVAGLFAVHPLHVESVAWVSERKDVLSTFFCLLCLRAYVGYAARPSWLRLAGVTLLFALGLTAKSMLVTLPCLFLLLDAWPLRRLPAPWPPSPGVDPCPQAKPLRLVAEKLPLFALASAAAALTLQAQDRMMEALDPLPLYARAGNALVYYVTYPGRMFWPAHLTPYHPNPQVWLGWLPTLGSGLLLAAFSIFVATHARRRPYLLLGWLWFLGAMVPVIGLVQVGLLATTDHYTYVPLIGLYILLAWGVHDLCESWPLPRFAPVLLSGAALCLCVPLTRRQLGYWQSSATVWQRVLDVGPETALAHSFLAQALEEKGREAEADQHYARASELDPTWKEHVQNGLALEQQGDLWGARRELETALLIAPHDVTSLEHLAVQCQQRKEYRDAVKHYTTLARIHPHDAGPEYNLGLLYQEQGDLAKAREHWLRALAIDPALPEARKRLDAL